MPFSHHSHSGQFCGHAANTLEEVVQQAVAKKMTTFCMTEHMPRNSVDFYPEEAEHHSEESLSQLFDAFMLEARRLQTAYAAQIQLFVGFEVEWIRASSLGLVQTLMTKHAVDLFVGSVHHVHTIPIDYDHEMYHQARDVAGGTDERIFEDYFDAQYAMLQALRPPVVGHFDLIRLKSDDPEGSFRKWPAIWEKIERNLRFIAEYGGVLELNSSSLRKGMSEAYPQSEICQVFKGLGGRFTLSDDSHGIEQVGLNFSRTMATVEKTGISDLACLAPMSDTHPAFDSRFPAVAWESVEVESILASPFFAS